MERKLRVIKAYEQEYLYVIVNENEITFNGNLCDCKYNGLSLSHAEIGDYSFGQYDFDKDLKQAIKEAFSIDMPLDGLVIDKGSLDIHTYDADEEEELSRLIETKGDEIIAFADKWAAKHEDLVKGDYIEYWDGSNTDTIVLRSDIEDYSTIRDYELLDEDDEETIKVLQEFAAKELIDEDFYGKRYRSQSYDFCSSNGETWGLYMVEKIKEEEEDEE